MSRYVKAITALLTALGTWGYTAAADNGYSQQELWGLCGVLVVGLGVYAYPNTAPADEEPDPSVSELGP
jgi:hypothetical protein